MEAAAAQGVTSCPPSTRPPRALAVLGTCWQGHAPQHRATDRHARCCGVAATDRSDGAQGFGMRLEHMQGVPGAAGKAGDAGGQRTVQRLPGSGTAPAGSLWFGLCVC